jgi:hypothetical protein
MKYPFRFSAVARLMLAVIVCCPFKAYASGDCNPDLPAFLFAADETYAGITAAALQSLEETNTFPYGQDRYNKDYFCFTNSHFT